MLEMEGKKYYTPTEICIITGLGYNYLLTLIRTNRIPAVTINRRRYIPEEAIERIKNREYVIEYGIGRRVKK